MQSIAVQLQQLLIGICQIFAISVKIVPLNTSESYESVSHQY